MTKHCEEGLFYDQGWSDMSKRWKIEFNSHLKNIVTLIPNIIRNWFPKFQSLTMPTKNFTAIKSLIYHFFIKVLKYNDDGNIHVCMVAIVMKTFYNGNILIHTSFQTVQTCKYIKVIIFGAFLCSDHLIQNVPLAFKMHKQDINRIR